MQLAECTRVVFDEDFHTYLLDDSKVPLGVTSLMKKHGLSPDYSTPSGYTEDEWQDMLAHAAHMGSMAHKEIEDYCNGLPVNDSNLIRSFRKLCLNIVATEYLVTDYNVVASSIDLVEEVGEGVYDLLDMKRTSTLHKDALRWQLGIYKYLFEKMNPDAKVRNCYGLHILKGNRDDILRDKCQKPTLINPVSAEEVEALLDCERRGVIYKPKSTTAVLDLTADQETLMLQTVPEILELTTKMKVLENTVKEVKEAIYTQMLEKGIDECEVAGFKIKLKRPYQKQTFDGTAFRKKHPKVYEKYLSTSEVKGSVLITSINK